MIDHTDKAVQKEYNRLAAIYDRRWERYLAGTKGCLRRHLKCGPNEVVLDVACGAGLALELFEEDKAGRPAFYIGADLTEKMLEKAAEKIGETPAALVRADAARLPFADGFADQIVCISALQYFPDLPRVLGEFRRLLKPGGQAHIIAWNPEGVALRAFDLAMTRFDPAHQGSPSPKTFRRLAESRGFQIGEVERFRIGAFWRLFYMRLETREGL